jgi:hypothetical protein
VGSHIGSIRHDGEVNRPRYVLLNTGITFLYPDHFGLVPERDTERRADAKLPGKKNMATSASIFRDDGSSRLVAAMLRVAGAASNAMTLSCYSIRWNGATIYTCTPCCM